LLFETQWIVKSRPYCIHTRTRLPVSQQMVQQQMHFVVGSTFF
jgi:hypothetical protein